MGASYVGMSSVPTGIENPQNGYRYPRFGTGILGSVPVFQGRTGKYRYQKHRKSVPNIFPFWKFGTCSKPVPYHLLILPYVYIPTLAHQLYKRWCTYFSSLSLLTYMFFI
ncbi:hypothetical protein HanXRQr2_Chr09g0386411 [Helianthus annuus]|uniref:Uncharacterized protein n=1 Tax=Helianthus annuus TaxID=4232 RepID=A0A9K3I5Y5_HELAN|nr:hypothetical protein HanXRQr2_Chr09g0386411 [Helianthus annuus]KAJ0892981.1 hypothetical protein HanPSC8_Chr09g0372391 [Helianthus annuus]